jgi:hypothetical protein
MSLTFACECGKQLRAPEEFVGRQTKCPGCGRSVTVPSASVPTAPTAALQASPPSPTLPTLGAAEPELAMPFRAKPSGLALFSIGLAALAIVLPLLVGIPVAVWVNAGWAAVVSLCMPLSLGVPAAILGIMGLNSIGRSQGKLSGRGLAIAGLIFGLVAAIGGVIVGVSTGAFAAVASSRNAANRISSGNNLRQVGLAFINYHNATNAMPLGEKSGDGDVLRAKGLSWRVDILPFIEEDLLYQQFHLDEPWDSPHNLKLIPRMPALYRSPRFESQPGTTYYRALVGPGTVMGGPKPLNLDFISARDGAFATLVVVEAAEPVIWTKPDELRYDPNGPLPGFGGPQRGDFIGLFADAHIQHLSMKMGEQTLRAYITVDGNEVIPQR